MEPLDYYAKENQPHSAKLQAASIYHRHFYCRICKRQVIVCNQCDRSQVYCSECGPQQKRVRLKRAQKKYNQTRHGRRLRAASSKRRRDKIKSKIRAPELLNSGADEKIEGDRASPQPKDIGINSEPAILAEQETKGVSDNAHFPNSIFNSPPYKSEQAPRKATEIICSFCKRECSPFQRQKKGRLGAQERKAYQRWSRRSRDEDP
jgi:hypothetical protein